MCSSGGELWVISVRAIILKWNTKRAWPNSCADAIESGTLYSTNWDKSLTPRSCSSAGNYKAVRNFKHLWLSYSHLKLASFWLRRSLCSCRARHVCWSSGQPAWCQAITLRPAVLRNPDPLLPPPLRWSSYRWHSWLLWRDKGHYYRDNKSLPDGQAEKKNGCTLENSKTWGFN